MAVKTLIFAGLCATASLAQAVPMGAAEGPDNKIKDGIVHSAPAQLWLGGAVFTNGPADTSALGNGGVTGGPSAPPPFTNVAQGQGPNALPPPPVSIPEPASAALLLAGLAGVAAAARRRRK